MHNKDTGELEAASYRISKRSASLECFMSAADSFMSASQTVQTLCCVVCTFRFARQYDKGRDRVGVDVILLTEGIILRSIDKLSALTFSVSLERN